MVAHWFESGKSIPIRWKSTHEGFNVEKSVACLKN